MGDDADADSYRLLSDHLKEGFALPGIQLLAIPNQFEPGKVCQKGQDNSAGDDWAGKGSPPDFIDTGDQFIAK